MMPQSFSRYLPLVEGEMRRAVGDDHALLYRMMRYHLGWEEADGSPSTEGAGKALRPVLCLLTCEALCGSPEVALPAAAAIEILHNFSLVHDDIQDRDRTRRGRATAWTVWGEAQAINAGDGLWALSTRTLLRAAEQTEVTAATVLRAAQMLNDASLTMIEGQALDLSFELGYAGRPSSPGPRFPAEGWRDSRPSHAPRGPVTVEQYLDMIARKTGALIARSISIGALFGGASDAQVEAFERYGALLGRIFQVRDDVLGIWGEEAVTGKSATSDIRRKKQSLPVVYALSRDSDAAADLAAVYAKPDLDDADVTRAVALLDETGAREFAMALAWDAFGQASEALVVLPLGEDARREFDAMGRFLLEREK
jgi:geranylgeranyl diphosphate synthase type I